MGNWAFTVIGTGSLRKSGAESGADQMAEEFVRALRKSGQRIESATLTYGSRDIYYHEPYRLGGPVEDPTDA